MMIVAPPDIPPQEPLIVVQVLAVKPVNDMTFPSFKGEMGSCMVSPTVEHLGAGVSPIATGEGMPLFPELTALRWFPDAESNVDLQAAAEAAPVQVIQTPAYGTVTYNMNTVSLVYKPNPTYVGNDKVVFVVDIDGSKIKVTHFIEVINTDVTLDNHSELLKKYCPQGSDWRISDSSTQG
jgi:hypothetical protein